MHYRTYYPCHCGSQMRQDSSLYQVVVSEEIEKRETSWKLSGQDLMMDWT